MKQKYPFPDYPPVRFGPVIDQLTRLELIPPLGPGVPNEARRAALEAFDPRKDLNAEVKDQAAARACHAGLWLLHNFLEESHRISQELETPEGSFWHAIMHRREPDPMNSKYWFRRVGSHVVFDQLVQLSARVGYQFMKPELFVDFTSKVRGTGGAEEETARWVQLLEWQLLFNCCWDLATTGVRPKA